LLPLQHPSRARRLLRATTFDTTTSHFMHKAPNRSSKKDILRKINKTPREFTQSSQYGQHSSHLLLLPSESLTHITSFLDPKSLISLQRTSRKLYQHVQDDNTWRRAFLCQFLGVSPENDVNQVKALTFRLTEKTWRREFLRRHAIRGCVQVLHLPASRDLILSPQALVTLQIHRDIT
jgi:F-box-like